MTTTKSFTLTENNELRFEVEQGYSCTVTLTSGSCELFGVPLVVNESYTLGIGRYAMFSWFAKAEVQLSEKMLDKKSATSSSSSGASTTSHASGNQPLPSPLATAYLTEEARSPFMWSAINLHRRLETSRELAIRDKKRGPVVLLAGPADSGKSTLSRTLLAYAARRSRRPIFVDLDPGQNDIGPPGCVAATSVDVESISVEEGVSAEGALVFFYGHASPNDSIAGYKKAIEKLHKCVESRMASDPNSQASGIVINTCGWVDGPGYDLLTFAITTFKCDLVLVLGGQDVLGQRLQGTFNPPSTASSNPTTKIVRLPLSGGATSRNQAYRKKARDRKIQEYFYGKGGNLSPGITVVDWNDVIVLKLLTSEDLPDESMRPVGAAAVSHDRPSRVTALDRRLQNSLVGVSHAQAEAEAGHKSVAGFVLIQSVDLEKKRLTLLCPQTGELPSKVLLLGGIKTVDV